MVGLTQATIDRGPLDDERVRTLQEQLRRERSARVGVERGLEALSERLTELQRENRELRERLGTRT
jgi:regulator of replication initiation timing